MSSRKKQNRRIGVAEIQEGVELFNTDGNNLVNPFEIKEAMQILGLREKKPNLYSLIETLCNRKDIKKNGGLTVEEFVSFLEDQMNDTESDEGLTKLFDIYRDPKSETAPINNFCQVAKDVEDNETANDLREAIDNSEMNGKEIDFDEFREIMGGTGNKKDVYRAKKPTYTTTKVYTNKPIVKEKVEEKIETQPVYKYKKKDENPDDDNKVKYSHTRIKIEKENTPKYEKPDIEIQKEIIIEKSEPVEYKKAADGKFYRVVNDDKNKEANNSVKIEITKQTEQEVDPDKKGKSSRVVIEKIITTEQVVEENVVEPGSGSRYRYNRKKDNNNNPEVVEKEIEVTKEVHYPYKGRAVRPANNNDKVENVNDNKEEEQEDKKDENDKRYHRRYRYNYSQKSGDNGNNNNNNNNNNNATSTGATSGTSYYRYRRKQ